MAFTFSNLLKAGAVHRYKTFAVLYVLVWVVLPFSLFGLPFLLFHVPTLLLSFPYTAPPS